MSKVDTLIKKLCQKPTPADFRYSDLRKIMAYFGYVESNKGATSGSRVRFYNPENKASMMLHKPHPGNIIKAYAMKQVLNEGEFQMNLD